MGKKLVIIKGYNILSVSKTYNCLTNDFYQKRIKFLQNNAVGPNDFNWVLVVDENNKVYDLNLFQGGQVYVDHLDIFKDLVSKYEDLEITDSINYIYKFAYDLFKQNQVIINFNIGFYNNYYSLIDNLNDIVKLLIYYQEDINNKNLYKNYAVQIYNFIMKEKDNLFFNYLSDKPIEENKYNCINEVIRFTSFLFFNLSVDLMNDYLIYFSNYIEGYYLKNKKSNNELIFYDFTYNYKIDSEKYCVFVKYIDYMISLFHKYINENTEKNTTNFLDMLCKIFYDNGFMLLSYHNKEEVKKRENTEFIQYYKKNSKNLSLLIETLEKVFLEFSMREKDFYILLYLFGDEINWNKFNKNRLIKVFQNGIRTKNFKLTIDDVYYKKYKIFMDALLNNDLKVFFTFLSLIEKEKIIRSIDFICDNFIYQLENNKFEIPIQFLLDDEYKFINPEVMEFFIETLTEKINLSYSTELYKNYINFLKLINPSLNLLDFNKINKEFKITYLEIQLKK